MTTHELSNLHIQLNNFREVAKESLHRRGGVGCIPGGDDLRTLFALIEFTQDLLDGPLKSELRVDGVEIEGAPV
jgi:hypothetical protein